MKNSREQLRGEKFSWFISSKPWGTAERLYAYSLLGIGLLFLLPGPTFSISRTYFFLGEIWGANRYGFDTAETFFGLYQIALAAHQLWQLRRNNRKWRRIGMFLMMTNFATQGVAFGVSNIYYGDVGTGWWQFLLFAYFAFVSWAQMGAEWGPNSNVKDNG